MDKSEAYVCIGYGGATGIVLRGDAIAEVIMVDAGNVLVAYGRVYGRRGEMEGGVVLDDVGVNWPKGQERGLPSLSDKASYRQE